MKALRVLPILIVSAAMSSLGAQVPRGTTEMTRFTAPPRLDTFTFEAPAPVAFGRLWMDVGMFHPWTGSISRQEWDRVFYPLMNRVSSGALSLKAATAEALGALGDPASMALGPEEGRGSFFLPVLFQVHKDGLWIAGGSKATVSSPFGPIVGVNGAPLAQFIGEHVGSHPTDAQVLAVMQLATVGDKAATWKLTDAKGRELTVTTSKALPADAWIDGGWKGTPVHELAGEKVDLDKINALDLRSLAWFPPDSWDASGLTQAFIHLGGSSVHQGKVLEVGQAHEGFSEGMANQDPYRASTLAEPMVAMEGIGPKREIRVTPPAVLMAEPDVVRFMVGWAMPEGLNAPCATSLYPLNSTVSVRLRLTSLTDTAPHSSQSLYGGPLDYLSPGREAAYKNLTVTAAKNLAAASILNWVQHYGFIQEGIQEQAFKGIASLPEQSSSVHDLLLRASAFLREPHSTAFALDFRDYLPVEREKRTATKRSRLPFVGIPLADGTMTVLRPAVGAPVKTGAVVTAINGRPMKDLIREMSIRVPTPDNPFRICKDMGMLFPYDTPLSLTFKNPGEPEQTTKAEPVTYDGPWQDEDPSVVKDLADKGWTYIGKPRSMKGSDLTEGLAKGQNYILDCRFVANSISGGGLPRVPSWEDWVRRPSQPIAWGQPDALNSLVVQASSSPGQGTGKTYPGKLVILVWGITQSSMESVAIYYHDSFISNCFVVGTRTSGITGACSYLKLPLGESERVELFSATANWPTFEGRPIQYTGVPLDLHLDEAEILKAHASGSLDAYLTVFMKQASALK